MLIGIPLGLPGVRLYLPLLCLKPARFVKPDILMDNPEPHRFAQGLGGIFMTRRQPAPFFYGLPILGWGLVWLVIGLAALNAFAGFCVGCMVYYWLSRLHIPGFAKSPPAGETFPGMKPKTQVQAMKPDLLTDPLLQRLLVALALVALGLAGYSGCRINSSWPACAAAGAPPTACRDKPVLLYFTTPTCAPCKTVQRPAIQRLEELSRRRLEGG